MSKLATITSGRDNLPARVVVYGPNGIGKTTFAAESVSPVMILTEDGIGNLEVSRFPVVTRFDEIIGYLETLLHEEHSFRFACLDSLDWTERVIFNEIECRHTAAQLAYGKKYEIAVEYWGRILSLLDKLREVRRMGCILVGHSIANRYDAPTGESYDVFTLDLHKKSASYIRDWADVILFANYQIKTRETADGRRTVAVGEGERVMFTEERPAFWAKNRYGLPAELPFSFAAYANAMKAARSPKPKGDKDDNKQGAKATPTNSKGSVSGDGNINTAPTQPVGEGGGATAN